METHLDVCKNNCPGVENDGKGNCCVVADRNWILGPIEDSWEVLDRLQEIYPTMRYEDVFISYEEGKLLYPDKSAWQEPSCYPAMRLVNDACKFLQFGECTIHEQKSRTCKDYKCPALLDLVRIIE